MNTSDSKERIFPDVLRPDGAATNRKTVKVVCHEHKFVYAAVPKVATRSILAGLGSQDFETEQHRMSISELFETGTIDNDYTLFSFVRNPWSRIRSTYTNKLLSDNPLVETQILRFYPGLEKGMEFKDFLEYVTYAEGGGDLLGDRHWVSQYLQLELPQDRLGKLQLHIGRLENLQADFDNIIEQLGLDPIALETLNSRHGFEDSAKKIDYLSSHRQHFDDEMVGWVADRYERDIATFDYSF